MNVDWMKGVPMQLLYFLFGERFGWEGPVEIRRSRMSKEGSGEGDFERRICKMNFSGVCSGVPDSSYRPFGICGHEFKMRLVSRMACINNHFSQKGAGVIYFWDRKNQIKKNVFSNLQTEIPTSPCNYLVKNFSSQCGGPACSVELSAAIEGVGISAVQDGRH